MHRTKKIIVLVAINLATFGITQETTETFYGGTSELINQTGGSGREQANSIASDNFGNLISAGVFSESITLNVMEKDEHDEYTVQTPLTLTVQGRADGIITKYNRSGDLIWVTQLSASYLVNPEVISTNMTGTVFVAGVFVGDFAYTVDGKENVLTSKGPDGDPFIMELDKNGKIEWVRQFGGYESRVSFSEMKIGSNNTLYITGMFSGQTNFNTSTKWAEKHPEILFSGGENRRAINSFLLKLNYRADFEWVRQISGDEYVKSTSLALDNDDNSYVVGEFSGIINFSDESIQKVEGGVDSYVAKYDTGGGLLWTKYFGSEGNVKISSIDLNLKDEGKIVICGNFNSEALEEQESDAVEETPYSSFLEMATNGSIDGFVLCLNFDGGMLWRDHVRNDFNVHNQSVAWGSNDYLIVNGYIETETARILFIKEIDIDGLRLSDFIIAKGNVIPVKTIINVETDETYVLGQFNGELEVNSNIYNSNGDADVFILKLD